ncbi:MAG: crossover junction endodeoxyribonuclease RuvC [Planctomycetota bacterium]|nr:crossover junction endodeoxyribonuclease RuvC [Planctomycetota bacterium]MDA1114337.1 crossover junction endodeoxyribonuclease RuvC [Planctomycetota bacterium]
MAKLRILGIDPGSQVVGWAIAESDGRGQLARIDSGAWTLGRAPTAMGVRLHRLHQHLVEVFEKYQPQSVALEAAFFGKNAQSALRIGEARGIVLMTSEAYGVPLVELSPATVKVRVAGTGSATKEQVEHLVRVHYGLTDFEPATADESDALAVAACALLNPAGQDATSFKTSDSGGLEPRNRGKLPPGATFQ